MIWQRAATVEHICNRLNFDFSKILLISAENLMQPKTSERDSTAFRLLGYCLPATRLQPPGLFPSAPFLI